MLSWKEIVQNYIIKHSDRIKKTTRPLKDHFGVAYFTYHRIDLEGRYTVLVDRPDWAEHYVSEQFFLNDPYLRHPDVYRSGFCSIENHGSDEYKERVIKSGKEIFNLDLGVMFIEKSETGVEFFGFAGNRKDSNLEKIYANYPFLLKSYAKHFKREMGSVLKEMEGEASSLIDLKGEDFRNQEKIGPDLGWDSKCAYLKDLGLGAELEKAAGLSLQERNCMKHLREGKTAKETAFAMGISPRTVESYLENIKDKTGCWNKSELFSLAKDLELLGLF